MKIFNNRCITLAAVVAICFGYGLSGCTKLDEKVFNSKYFDSLAASGGSGGAVPTQADLDGAYNNLNGFSDQANIYALQEHPTDEMMGPTRGTDWDDFGTWRKLHLHSWDASHNQLYDTWNNLNRANYSAYLIAEKATDTRIKAEASFLRAFFSFNICDIYGQIPYRPVDAESDAIPLVYTRSQAFDKIVSDLDFAISNLSNATDAGIANKQSAQFLLAKMYLNKAVYKQDPNSPAGPFNFEAADMTKVIEACNSIIASGKYSLSASGKYWDNFKWDNTEKSTELIFVRKNDNSNQPANSRNRTYMGFHYNQTPSGWNGFTTLSEFYDSFEPGDIRRGDTIPGFTDSVGYGAGFLIGQQYGPKKENDAYIRNANGTRKMFPLSQRDGNPLVFTRNVDLGFATEAEGIRVVKYPLNPARIDNSENDYVFFRYADVILMKAEAILRGGTDPNNETALSLVNNLRSLRGASTLATLSLSDLLAERGRELFYEGWRRNDQIRFGTFNNPVDQRKSPSAGYRVVYPIPSRALATNPNLKQNFGY